MVEDEQVVGTGKCANFHSACLQSAKYVRQCCTHAHTHTHTHRHTHTHTHTMAAAWVRLRYLCEPKKRCLLSGVAINALASAAKLLPVLIAVVVAVAVVIAEVVAAVVNVAAAAVAVVALLNICLSFVALMLHFPSNF